MLSEKLIESAEFSKNSGPTIIFLFSVRRTVQFVLFQKKVWQFSKNIICVVTTKSAPKSMLACEGKQEKTGFRRWKADWLHNRMYSFAKLGIKCWVVRGYSSGDGCARIVTQGLLVVIFVWVIQFYVIYLSPHHSQERYVAPREKIFDDPWSRLYFHKGLLWGLTLCK